VVEREPYDLLFGEHKAPDGTPLGKPSDSGRKAADIYATLLAEPHATAELKQELRLEATGQARQSPMFFDLTVSLSKSVSIFHASLGENARLARQAGILRAMRTGPAWSLRSMPARKRTFAATADLVS
jgi:hypothetical protein